MLLRAEALNKMERKEEVIPEELKALSVDCREYADRKGLKRAPIGVYSISLSNN